MDSLKRFLSSQMERMDSTSLSRRIAHPNCSADDVKAALCEGFNPNTLWADYDTVFGTGEPMHLGPRDSQEITWANVDTPLQKLSLARKFDAALVLLANGAQIDLLNAHGRTPLHEAINKDLLEVVGFLIECGADVNAVSEARSFKDQKSYHWGSSGIVPLHETVRNLNPEILEMLIGAGADYNHISSDGWTILDLALLERDESVVNLLIQHGARISQQTIAEESGPESLRISARLLLANQSMFPPEKCRQAYLYVISRPEFIEDYKLSTTSEKLLDTFLGILCQAAELPNPEKVPGAPCCVSCVSYLKALSPQHTGPFELHPNRYSLTKSAKGGCCLCAIFEDALSSDISSDGGESPQET